MQRFDLLGPLPQDRCTVVLEASAGTGKTFTLAALVTRYLADGVATIDQVLLITFGRVASRELRERVRTQIASAAAVLEGRQEPTNDLEHHLIAAGDAAQCAARLRDALAEFDAATILTIHQFCSLVLKSLGVYGDNDSRVTLVESLHELIGEIVDDLYLAHFGNADQPPPLTRRAAITLAERVADDPAAVLRPAEPAPGSTDAARLAFAKAVLDELEHRKRRMGVLGYNDLLIRLADALQHSTSHAADRMRQRWRIVMVDEFQDTDAVQWHVIERAFRGHCTLVLIGDPKQAIYGFRGGDIYTYLTAVRSADDQRTLATNYRSDKVLVDSLQTVLGGAELGHRDITVPPVQAHLDGHRLSGAPHNAPFRLRVVKRTTLGANGLTNLAMGTLREHIPADLAADIGALLHSGAHYGDRPLRAGDIAVIVDTHQDAAVCREALSRLGIPVVYTGDTDVFGSRAAEDWLCLLEAFDQPGRTGLARAAACTMFFGETAESLASGGDQLTDRVTATLREWTDLARLRGVAAVLEAAQLAGMGRRVLRQRGGERHMTDLSHISELLNEKAHSDRLGLPALRNWLRQQRKERTGAPERNRRLDSDAGAVQVMTVFAAKGLQFPIVYLPFMFRLYIRDNDNRLYHEHNDDGSELRCLYIGESATTDVKQSCNAERALDHIRTTYVGLTRAQSQVVAWWAPASDELNGGLSRLLRGRRPGEAQVPNKCAGKITDEDAWTVFNDWQARGGPVVEDSVVGPPTRPVPPEDPGALSVRHFHRRIDTGWRRTSYSALIRHADDAHAGVHTEPESHTRDDESDDLPLAQAPADADADADMLSPMAELPRGATFGSLVHATLETADPFAADLAGELADQVRRHEPWWPIGVDAAVLAQALIPMHDTALGPLADGLTLRQIGMSDRLRELDFEIPLAGGDSRGDAPQVRVADVGALLHEHLPATDPFAIYADRLTSDALGSQALRGYLSGSLDVVLRVPEQRYLVVDYKTNHLGDRAADYSFPRMAEAMLHSDYPLQALLYTAVLHRFLRWRQPGYQPDRHLAGVLYLFVRGMCGPSTPVRQGHPAGVFSWQPPADLVVALSDLLHRGVA